jgi:FtsH-binding integral membrane protein
MPDSIIVYRNPVEKMFWEQGGFGHALIFGAAMLVTFLVVFWLVEQIKSNNKASVPVALTLSIIAGCIAVWLTL